MIALLISRRLRALAPLPVAGSVGFEYVDAVGEPVEERPSEGNHLSNSAFP
jgi:hypothetical protein